MSDREYSCADEIKKVLPLYFWSFVVIFIITNIIGYSCIYFMLRKKIYHTYHMTRETMEQIHDVNANYDRSVGHIVVSKTH